MRIKSFAAGIAVLVVAGIWQLRADSEKPAGQQSPAKPADLVKHGEYLVNRVAQCGDCHTPRDAKGELDSSKLLQGTILGVAPKKKTDHWADKSPDISASGIAGKWSEEEMIRFFSTGTNPEGKKPTPPMPVFRLHEQDARAVTLYLKSLPGKKGSQDGER